MKTISEKSRTATFLFAFFLGTFGIHRFYVGKTGSAIAMLLLTLSLIGLLVTAFWALIDWIMVACGTFKDGQGNIISAW
jgi:TM2 domain-containing membrane protein YozV